ncbi:low affinity iron permease family protein [Paracoccus sulfuroxidans]|uniref:Low affinity iron permease n=1 Tax=Paracoccus sulfuroxidans TaxID=384678 RepID=A0A562N7T5_9RHOB|nr:low affinity iron permease [Paracoccus sulfuroxidans]
MERLFTRVAGRIAYWAGSPIAFALCIVFVLIWLVSGPVFGFSDSWQLIINTSTTIITFMIVFLVQNTQNRDIEPRRVCRRLHVWMPRFMQG